jgi:ABC-type transport system substrate-binding protein
MKQHGAGRVTRSGLVVAAMLTLLAVACGGSSDSDDEQGTSENGISEGKNTSVSCRAGFDVENPDGDGEPMAPERGGTISVGVEAETDGWNAASNRWALSGNLIANTFYDTLTKPGADGTFVPYLAESVEANDDYTVWTITLREGVEFHDGTPLTADAVKRNLDEYRSAVLTAAALSNIKDVEVVDDLTVDVVMNGPWVPFPQYLSSQIGVVMAPSMFDDENSNQNPVGTGPFKFEDWAPDSRLTVVRNENYWQTGEDGEPLPYLDGIEFVPLPDPTQRKASLDAGDVQVIHTFTADQITELRERAEEGELNAYESCAWGEDEEFLIMFNNGKPPFDDPRAREAVSRAIDRDAVIEALFGDTFQIATGPWAPGSPWYAEPETPQVYDPDLARELAQQYEEEHGEPIRFTLGAPSSIQEALTSQQLTKQYLEAVGIEVELDTSEFAQYVLDGVTGDYQANIWRQFGAPDPDGEYVWWHPDNVKPVGELSLNIGRFSDEELGAALDRGRESDDPAVRQEAYAEVQRIFQENFYLGWSAHAFWSVASQPEVQDLVNWTSPEGTQGMPLSGGTHPFAQVWLKSDQ